LSEYGQYQLHIIRETAVEGGSSKVDYVMQANDADKVLVEAKSPSVMNKLGELLPPHGIELTWAVAQSLVPKVLAKVSMPFLSALTSGLTICTGRLVSGSEKIGVALSHMPQSLDRVSACEA
jgi:hypothetical protein